MRNFTKRVLFLLLVFVAVSSAFSQDAPDAKSLYTEAMKYVNGDGVDVDVAKGIELLTKSASYDYAESYYELGLIYQKGYHVDVDAVKANEYFFKAAGLGDVNAMNSIGYAYYNGTGVEQDYTKSYEWFLKSATGGNADSMNRVGLCYLRGKGVKTDGVNSVIWFRKGAELGNQQAVYNYALCIIVGLCDKDLSDSEKFDWLQKAARGGCTDAQLRLGHLYFNGKGVKQDFKRSLLWFFMGAANGNYEALNNLSSLIYIGCGTKDNAKLAISLMQISAVKGKNPAAMLNYGRIIIKGVEAPKDEKLGFDLMVKSAESNDSDAYQEVGELYEKGIGCEKDYDKALYWYSRSVEQKSQGSDLSAKAIERIHAIQNGGVVQEEPADDEQQETLKKPQEQDLSLAKQMYKKGIAYQNGNGVEKDDAKAYDCFCKAAEMGYPDAYMEKGVALFSGIGVKQDTEECVIAFLNGATAGSDDALFDLALLLEDGKYIPQNYDLMDLFLFTAADNGNGPSCMRLGYNYYVGRGVEKNYEKSFEYTKKAVDVGYMDAVRNLACMYEDGVGCTADIDKAIEYFKLDAANGNTNSQEDVDRLTKRK